MPPLNEGSILYMPITLPGIGVTEAGKYLQIQDKLIRQFPEVQSVYGKIGKSDTATDPAPMSMVETTVVLKPESEWRTEHRARWYSQLGSAVAQATACTVLAGRAADHLGSVDRAA